MKIGILNKAIKEAQESEHKFRLGAVIFKGSRIFGSGHNSNRSFTTIFDKYKKFPNSCHAEMAALSNITNWEKVNGSSILVLRLNKSGTLSNSSPCKYCTETLKHYGIKMVYYSSISGEIKRKRL